LISSSEQITIDLRSGQPAETSWPTITAFAPYGAVAETFATAILIGGPEIAQTLAWKNPQISYLTVGQDGCIRFPEPTKCVCLSTENV
jgi:thiamine biosynthesis lipoprotein ApbE